MKKIVVSLLCATMVFTLCSCGSEKAASEEVKEEAAVVEETKEAAAQDEAATVVELGETISTDILEITVDSAELAFFASSVNDNTYATPVESTNGIFTTNKGHVFVCLKFGVKNTDRAKVSLGDSFGIPFELVLPVFYAFAINYAFRSNELKNELMAWYIIIIQGYFYFITMYLRDTTHFYYIWDSVKQNIYY